MKSHDGKSKANCIGILILVQNTGYHNDGFLIGYSDKIGLSRTLLFDGFSVTAQKNFSVSGPLSGHHACSYEGIKLPFTLWKKVLELHADYHDDMNGGVFGDWFKDSYSDG